MCDQQKLRPACTYAQSDQSLFLSLEYSMIVKLLTEQSLAFLSLKGDCTGSSESSLVKMSHCWKSHVTALMSNYRMFLQRPVAGSIPHWSRFKMAEYVTKIYSYWLYNFFYKLAFTVRLFGLILYVPSTIFQLIRDGSSWVEPVLS